MKHSCDYDGYSDYGDYGDYGDYSDYIGQNIQKWLVSNICVLSAGRILFESNLL